MDDSVLGNHVFKEITYLEPRLLEGYTQLQGNEETQAYCDDEEIRSTARDWIFTKQMLSCTALHRLTVNRKKFLTRQPSKIPSSFVLRPTKVEGSPSQINKESGAFKGFLSRNTNYVTTSTRRKKLAMYPNWNSIKNPELELKIRKQWIQENKQSDLDKFKETKLNEKDNNAKSDSSKNLFPELGSELKKVYGSPIFIQPFPKPRRPPSCSFQPVITGIQLQCQSALELKQLNESASGDSVSPNRSTQCRRFRKLNEKKIIKSGKKKKESKTVYKETKEKEFTDISDITDSDSTKKIQVKTSFFGDKTLVQIFTPIRKVFSSPSREKSSEERYKTVANSDNEFRSAVSDTSIESQSQFCRIHPSNNEHDSKDGYHECFPTASNSFTQQDSKEKIVIPATSLGPVSSKMTNQNGKNKSYKIDTSQAHEDASNRSSFRNQKKQSFNLNSASRLPSLLQEGLKRLSSTLHDDADDEGSSRYPKNSVDEKRRSRGRPPLLDLKPAVDDATKLKRRIRSKERKKQLVKQLEQQRVSSSLLLQADQSQRRKPRKKKRSKKHQDETSKNVDGWSYGSEGDDEREDESDDELTRTRTSES